MPNSFLFSDELFLKEAQVKTLQDAVELLTYLQQETSSQHWPALEAMAGRLRNMSASILPPQAKTQDAHKS
ncbi:hypothetical protein UFOVP1254_85 [uncultured Caudovirales phage]|uniref:Uncharacterized protein n=1 Tax=uncultured Caudovirales phage TaxID=2100421 RepID=A0A6J5RBW1_9CAUD|nr:hypothetical protein UFOVP1254_85 [uncultured Caudovirales phage]